LKFEPLAIAGAVLISIDPQADARGFFARTFCVDEFAAAGLRIDFVQDSISYNRRRGTLRGLHYQRPPHAETKIVRCTQGAVFDVVVDLRPDSPSFGRWTAVELTAENGRMVYIPAGLAHGFKTLADNTVVEYRIACRYAPAAAAGVRWDDPSLAIEWPATPELVISERDTALPWLEA
jgi:dTDP-4-dehydrorhamnose 3,5-epimerase